MNRILISFFILLTLLLCNVNGDAQTNQDSLQRIIHSGTSEEKIDVLIEVAGKNVDDSLSFAISYYNKAFDIAIKEKKLLKQAYILERKGVAYDIHGQFERAISCFDSSLVVYKTHFPNEDGFVSLYLNYGVAYYFAGDHTKALELYLKGYELCHNKRESRNYSLLVNNIGNVYKKIKQYDEAIRFFEESVTVKKKLGHDEGVANSLLNIGLIYSIQTKTDSALQYLQQAKDIYVMLGNKRSVASVDLAIADVYYRLDKTDVAASILQRWSEDDFLTLSAADRTVGYLLSIAIFNETHKPHEALKRAAEFERAFGSTISDETKRNLLFQKAVAYNGIGDNKRAYENLNEAYQLEKQFYEESNQQLMQEMQVRFSTEAKEREIELLQTEKKYGDLLLSDSKKRNQYFIGGAILFALISMILLLQYVKIRKQKKAISDSMEERARLVAMQSMLEGQEAERLRMAKDLHDGLGGLLSTIKSHFSIINNDVSDNQAVYSKTSELIDEACIEVRRISHNMMPHALTLSGIEGALEDLAANIRSQGINCKLEVKTNLQGLSESRITMIYRIIQELAQNAIKHSSGTEIFIQLLKNEEHIFITVEDNGKGFDMNKIKLSDGLGMSSVQSRVQFLTGKLLYDSVINTGTTVNIEIPIK